MSSPSASSSAPLDDSSPNTRETTRKAPKIRFGMKRREVDPIAEELVHTGEHDAKESTSDDSASNARDGNFRVILKTWPSWLTGRRGRKRKLSIPPDDIATSDMTQLEVATTNGDVVETWTTRATKGKSIMNPISEGETTSTLFMASACSVENKSLSTHEGKSVAANEKPKTHKCKYCPVAFAAGQQLGGHMRAHFKGSLTFSASSSSSSKRAKSKGIVEVGSSSGTARDKVMVGPSSESVKDKDANASSSSEATNKYATAAAAASSRSVMREMVVPLAFDLNKPPPHQEGEEQVNIDEGDEFASPLDLTVII